jgi:hypothetical protein
MKKIFGSESPEYLLAVQRLNEAQTGKMLFEVEQELALLAWNRVRARR